MGERESRERWRERESAGREWKREREREREGEREDMKLQEPKNPTLCRVCVMKRCRNRERRDREEESGDMRCQN